MAWWENEQSAGPRKWMFQNLSGETMPGFACIGLDPAQEAYFTTTAEVCLEDKRARCLQARKPTALHEVMQNPRLLAFNLKTPVLNNGYGYCVFEKPTICLINQNESPMVNDPLGPIAGAWHLSKAGCAFIYLGEDPAKVFDWTSGSVHYGTGIIADHAFRDLMVKTPADGIQGREVVSGDQTISSALCDRYREIGTIATGTMTLEAVLKADESPAQLRVYNISNDAVAGNTFVATSVLQSGVRYVVVESCTAES